MDTMVADKNIRVTKKQKKKLIKLKTHKRETYADVLSRILKKVL